jgi:magnesium transporter
MISDVGVYRQGRREDEEAGIEAAGAAARGNGGLAWVNLDRPAEDEIHAVTRAFGLHPLAVEDALHAHQRPKLERYGDALYCVLRPARYIDESETVEFGELHLFAGPRFVVTIRHDECSADVADVRRRLEEHPEILRRGPVAILHAVMDRVVDDYAPVVAGLENDIDEIEDQVFGERGDVSRRIYELSREVIGVQRATGPLVAMLGVLLDDPRVADEERRYLRDVQDHAIRVQEAVEGFRELLANILNVNLAIETKVLNEVSIAQNEEVKKISAWAAILFAPTLVGTIYGMNFRHMPELKWGFGYPMAVLMMLAVSGILYLVFKRRGWI